MKKIIFLFAVSLILGGCSFAVTPKNGITADQLSALNQKNQDLSSQVSKLQEDNKSLQAENESNTSIMPDNFGNMDTFCYSLKEFKQFNEVFPELSLDSLTVDQKTNLGKGNVYQVCENFNGDKSFVMYGDYGNNNNLIGFYALDSATGGQKMLIDFQYNQGVGDIGVCQVNGFIERNLVYSCGGGDGPGGFNTVYMLERATGKSKIIKKCEYLEDKMTCAVNLLNIKGLPY